MRTFVLMLAAAVCMEAAGADRRPRDPVAAAPTVVKAGSFSVLSYHEVAHEVRDLPDPFAVDAEALVRQFAWLRGNGFAVVSLDEVIEARRGGKPLPAKAVLLSFDDAYSSFYTRVYPLLREFRFPAVLGVVGKWIDDERRVSVRFGSRKALREAETTFVTWNQVREMAASGLVEIASHTYDLHRGIPANPQGNLQPAATARAYDAGSGRYEEDAAWRARVRADLATNSAAIGRVTGKRPRTVVWPYGSYNDELVRMAGELGMPVALTLDDGVNAPDTPLAALRRVLIEHNPLLAEFTTEERGPLYAEPVRVVQVDLDDVYSPDPAQAERNLSVLLDRVQVLKPTHVFLRATADSNGDGIADAAYFPNRRLPLRADLFNRVSWQLATRNDVKVFAMLPLAEFRLSRGEVVETYEDLARYANFEGLVFDDLRHGADDFEFTRELSQRVRAFRGPLKTVRTTLDLQRVQAFSAEYDYVALIGGPGTAPVDPATRRKLLYLLPGGAPRDGSGDIAARMRAMQIGGSLNFGIGRDGFLRDDPALGRIAPVMSLRVYPQAENTKEQQ